MLRDTPVGRGHLVVCDDPQQTNHCVVRELLSHHADCGSFRARSVCANRASQSASQAMPPTPSSPPVLPHAKSTCGKIIGVWLAVRMARLEKEIGIDLGNKLLLPPRSFKRELVAMHTSVIPVPCTFATPVLSPGTESGWGQRTNPLSREGAARRAERVSRAALTN